MKIAIVGSRSFHNYEYLIDIMCQYFCDDNNDFDKIDEIISGGAGGADSLAKRFATENNIPLKEFLADWSKGKSAGILRNTDIVAAADMVIAFWDLSSRGTKDSINKALKTNKPVLIVPVGAYCG